MLLLAAVGLMACLYHPQRRQMAKALALGVVLLVALLFPVLNKTKNHFFGVGFHLLLLIIGVLVLRWIFLGGKSGRSRVRAAIGWGIIVISIGLASWPLSLVRFAPSSPEISAIRRVQQGVYGTIRANMAGENSLVYYTCAGYVDGAGLRCRALLDGYDIGVNIEYLSTNLRQHQAAMEAADFVVAGEEGSDLMHPWLPSSTAQDQTLALLRRLPNFREIGAFAALHDKKIHVFQRLVSPVPDKLPAN